MSDSQWPFFAERMRWARGTSSVSALLLSVGCGGNAIKHHPVVEIAARSEARVDLVELAVSDPARAARVRELYLRVQELKRAFVEKRDAAWRETTRKQASPDFSRVADEVEAAADTTYREYARLMIEVRSLVTEREFARLNAIR